MAQQSGSGTRDLGELSVVNAGPADNVLVQAPRWAVIKSTLDTVARIPELTLFSVTFGIHVL